MRFDFARDSRTENGKSFGLEGKQSKDCKRLKSPKKWIWLKTIVCFSKSQTQINIAFALFETCTIPLPWKRLWIESKRWDFLNILTSTRNILSLLTRQFFITYFCHTKIGQLKSSTQALSFPLLSSRSPLAQRAG